MNISKKYEILNKNTLEDNYLAVGCFYSLELNDGSVIDCRSRLDIVDKGYYTRDFYKNPPQILFIMKNPGSATPLETFKKQPYSINKAPKLILGTQPIFTNRDSTISIIMSLMSHLGIKHVSIINISDIKLETDIFESVLNKISSNGNIHSIFGNERQFEKEAYFNNLKKDSIIFKAWGHDIVDNEFFGKLVNNCLNSIPKEYKQLGLAGRKFNKFCSPGIHDRNKQKEWLQKACEQIKDIILERELR
jgi:hypothetical protein